MLLKIRIQNFKSVLDEEIELGRFNVFIGANGSGKSNVIEALGMAAAAAAGRLTTEDLFNLGIRVARPSLMTSAFPGTGGRSVTLTLHFGDEEKVSLELDPTDWANHAGDWQLRGLSGGTPNPWDQAIAALPHERLGAFAKGWLSSKLVPQLEPLQRFAIFAPSTAALRGLETVSRREPLGLYGEGLDVAIARIGADDRVRMDELVRMVDWIDGFRIDASDRPKLEGLKIGRSRSSLYFDDRFLDPANRTFSAENANEGILHVMFHLALLLVPGGPQIFAVDNLETSLNPGMCRALTRTLARLAVERSKQVLATTHNPAILDGLDLNDDTQRLFVVVRDDDGHTKVRRIRLKPEVEGQPRMKLSELWLRGHLGALPEGF